MIISHPFVYLERTTRNQIAFYTETNELLRISSPGSTLLGLQGIACRPVAGRTAAVAHTGTSRMFAGGVRTRSNGYGLLYQYWVNVKRVDITTNG